MVLSYTVLELGFSIDRCVRCRCTKSKKMSSIFYEHVIQKIKQCKGIDEWCYREIRQMWEYALCVIIDGNPFITRNP